jgi:hypothetical protein
LTAQTLVGITKLEVSVNIWYESLLSRYTDSNRYLGDYEFDKAYQSSVIAAKLINTSFADSSSKIQYEVVDIIVKTHLILATCSIEKGCLSCAEKYFLGAIDSMKLIFNSDEFSLSVRSKSGQSILKVVDRLSEFYMESKMPEKCAYLENSENFKKYNLILVQ